MRYGLFSHKLTGSGRSAVRIFATLEKLAIQLNQRVKNLRYLDDKL
ncbi:hypothetical protein MPQ_0255 [Methylovorus sp. MP688]|jgi:hypothetical protein|nr:hypothetical protein MPQ_0255 [Methylovorus sp. MP688]